MTHFVKEEVSFLTAVTWCHWMLLKREGLIMTGTKPTLFAWSNCVWCFYDCILGNTSIFTIIIGSSSGDSSSSSSSSSYSSSSCFCCLCLLLLLLLLMCWRTVENFANNLSWQRLWISKPVVDDRKHAQVDTRSTLSIFCFQWLSFPVIFLSCKVNSWV